MVMFTVNYAAGAYTLSDTPPVTKVLTQVPAGGQTDYFFTSSNIYNATMFALQQPGGEWFGTLFYGRTAIGANGQVGFLPDAQVEGSVGGMSVDAFAANYVVEHGSNNGLGVALFAGDDTLIGNGLGGTLSGEAGDDVIIGDSRLDPLARQTVQGGFGDDVISILGNGTGFDRVGGGAGDDFIYMNQAKINASGGSGSDIFFFDEFSSVEELDDIQAFEGRDHVQLDPNAFTSLASGFSKENFRLDVRAVDANDYLVFSRFKNQGTLYYDPDGSGSQDQVAIAHFRSLDVLTWRNILVSDDTPVTDSLVPPGSAAHPDNHVAGLHPWAIHATGLLP